MHSFSRRRSTRGKNKGNPLVAPKVIRVRSVRLRPRLGYARLWKAYIPQMVKRLRHALERTAQRAERQAIRNRNAAIRKNVFARLHAQRIAFERRPL